MKFALPRFVGPWALLLGVAGLGLAATLAGLAWFDVLPGGWRLRSLVIDEGARSARIRAEHRSERLAAFASDAAPAADVLLIGSSTIERGGEAFLSASGATVRNRGIGDEPVALMAERFLPTLELVAPRLVVLYAASVDARRPTAPDGSWRPVADLAADVAELCDLALEADPDLGVVLLEILPETDPRPAVPERVEALSRAWAEIARERPRVKFFPLRRPPLVETDSGRLVAAKAADRQHLNAEGYRVLEAWLMDDPWVQRIISVRKSGD